MSRKRKFPDGMVTRPGRGGRDGDDPTPNRSAIQEFAELLNVSRHPLDRRGIARSFIVGMLRITHEQVPHDWVGNASPGPFAMKHSLLWLESNWIITLCGRHPPGVTDTRQQGFLGSFGVFPQSAKN